MTVLVTGGTGLVGRFIVEGLLDAGRPVVVAGRCPPPDGFFSGPVSFREMSLDPETMRPELFGDVDHVVHAAFHHVAGRYRGGEGNEPDAFRRLNGEGSIALFHAAKAAGVNRCVFISSRAVYGRKPAGILLRETTEPTPDTLYGTIKLEAETALRTLSSEGFAGASLRATGVYGPAGLGRQHKWTGLFSDFLAGKPVAPRCGTEVHGSDLAAAVELMLTAPPATIDRGNFNVSDMLVDRRTLLAIVERATGIAGHLPAFADADADMPMATEKLESLGWRPGGERLLRETVVDLARTLVAG